MRLAIYVYACNRDQVRPYSYPHLTHSKLTFFCHVPYLFRRTSTIALHTSWTYTSCWNSNSKEIWNDPVLHVPSCHNVIATLVSTQIAAHMVLAYCSCLLHLVHKCRKVAMLTQTFFSTPGRPRCGNSSERLASVPGSKHTMVHRTLNDSITTEQGHDNA